jgi:hypothetical protein
MNHMGAFADWWNGGSSAPVTRATRSVFSEGRLNPILASDIFGLDVSPVTVDECMRVASVVKARSILHALIPPRSLVAFRGDTRLAEQPTWTYRSDSGIPTQFRTAAILDDHIFHGESLLQITARGTDGFPLNIEHIERDRWNVEPDGTFTIDKLPVNGDNLIYIPGPWNGLLTSGADKVRESRGLDKAALSRARNPLPVLNVALDGDTSLDEDEMADLLGTISKARRDPDGAIIITPSGATLNAFGATATDYFEGGRNAVRIDFANMFALPASMLDSAQQGTNLDYSTQEGKRNEIYDYAISYWTTNITSWLSQDRVTPRGTSIRFDFSDLLTTTQTPTGPTTED